MYYSNYFGTLWSVRGCHLDLYYTGNYELVLCYTHGKNQASTGDLSRAAIGNCKFPSDRIQNPMQWGVLCKQIKLKASRDFLCFGYLEKTPPLQNVRIKHYTSWCKFLMLRTFQRWQKRYFVLDQNSLRYYHRPTVSNSSNVQIFTITITAFSTCIELLVSSPSNHSCCNGCMGSKLLLSV